jgi:hypothetical protein
MRDQIYSSLDHGDTWNFETAIIKVRDMDFCYGSDGIYGWAVGSFGRILKYYKSVTPVISDLSSALPGRVELKQNYPNPFNSVTTIAYSVLKTDHVCVEIYNLMGECVAVLLNEKHSPGEYRVTWDPAGLASGLYFCRMTAGESIRTIKLLLMQ